MIRSTLVCATMTLLLIHQAAGQDSPRPTPPASDADIYRAARSAIADARNRAAGRDVSTRKQAMSRATESALKATAARFSIDRERLDRIVEAGQLADGTAAKNAATSAKVAARANVQGQLNAVAVPAPARAGPPAGISRSDYRAVLRATGAIPPANPGTPRDEAAVAPPAAPGPDGSGMPVGLRATLARPGGAGHALLATDPAAYSRLTAAQSSGDLKAFSRLSDEGKVLRIANGTHAEVLELGDGSRRVRLIDGDRRGSEGWVDVRDLSIN